MKKFVYLSLLLSLFACSPHNPLQEGKVEEVLAESKDKKEPAILLLGDYRQIKEYRNSQEVTEAIRLGYNPYSIDISLKENRFLQYVFQFESLPTLLFIDSQGEMERLFYFTLEKSRVFSEQENRYLKTIISLATKPKQAISKDVSVEYSDDFLFNYLRAISFEDQDRDSTSFYCTRALSLFNEEKLFYPLYNDLIIRFSPPAIVQMNNDRIILPDLKRNEEIEVNYPIYNVGAVPLVFKSVSVSCSCLSVKHPMMISGYSEDMIAIKYKAGDVPGPINQNITLVTNAQANVCRIIISGNVI